MRKTKATMGTRKADVKISLLPLTSSKENRSRKPQLSGWQLSNVNPRTGDFSRRLGGRLAVWKVSLLVLLLTLADAMVNVVVGAGA